MKSFAIDFSGTMRAVKLKLGTHMDIGLMYLVYQNQGLYRFELHPLIGVTILPLIKKNYHTFLKNFKGYRVGNLVHTWTVG